MVASDVMGFPRTDHLLSRALDFTDVIGILVLMTMLWCLDGLTLLMYY